MPPVLLLLVSLVIIGMAVRGLLTGKVMAGSRGLRPNYYTKQDSPVLYYGFIFVYLSIGAFVLFHSM